MPLPMSQTTFLQYRRKPKMHEHFYLWVKPLRIKFFSTLGKDDGSRFRERPARSGTDCQNMINNPLRDEDIDPLRELRRI